VEASESTSVITIVLADDHEVVRKGLQLLLEAESGAGALAYVLKEAADDELVRAVRRAAAGETYLNPQLGARLAAEPPQPSGPPDGLSEREVEVLRMIALGHTNGEIAEQLYYTTLSIPCMPIR
jgi:two-component system response regulator NreC